MANVLDVASYILEQQGSMTAMKLQKLVYYCQAWSLVWDEVPLFDSKIEAWANGPVMPELYNVHRGQFQVTTLNLGSSDRLTSVEKETIDGVLGYYGDRSGQWLSDLTHLEDPWKNAREGISVGQRSTREITLAAMAEYYGSLEADLHGQKQEAEAF